MRPVRFVALSEDGQALVLADEVGRLLALPIDDRVATRAARRAGRAAARGAADRRRPDAVAVPAGHPGPHPLRRVRRGRRPHRRRAGRPGAALRRPGAAGAGHARPARPAHPAEGLREGAPLAEVVDGRLAQHGIDTEKISWDAYRRDDGTWRIVATWPSGKATAQAVWELDKARQHGRPARRHGAIPVRRAAHADPRPGAGAGAGRPRAARPVARRAEPGRARPAGRPARAGPPGPRPDPGRPRRAARLAGPSARRAAGPRPRPASPAAGRPDAPAAAGRRRRRGAARRRPGLAVRRRLATRRKEIPAVPSLAVLRPRRTARRRPPAASRPTAAGKPRKRLPSWDDVLFGSGPAARESS